MTFDVAAESYDRFMGGWSRPLAAPLADFAGVHAGMRVVDVGCGPGSLTTELVARLGADHVAAAVIDRRTDQTDHRNDRKREHRSNACALVRDKS